MLSHLWIQYHSLDRDWATSLAASGVNQPVQSLHKTRCEVEVHTGAMRVSSLCGPDFVSGHLFRAGQLGSQLGAHARWHLTLPQNEENIQHRPTLRGKEPGSPLTVRESLALRRFMLPGRTESRSSTTLPNKKVFRLPSTTWVWPAGESNWTRQCPCRDPLAVKRRRIWCPRVHTRLHRTENVFRSSIHLSRNKGTKRNICGDTGH
jgi:hypothetical protein